MQLPDYEKTEDFATRWKQKAREVLTEIEWRRRKMTLRVRASHVSHHTAIRNRPPGVRAGRTTYHLCRVSCAV